MRFGNQEVTLVEGWFGEPWDKEEAVFHKASKNKFWDNQKWKKKKIFTNSRNIMALTNFPNRLKWDDP